MSADVPDVEKELPCKPETPVPAGHQSQDARPSSPKATGRGVTTTGRLPTASIGARTVKSSVLSNKVNEKYAIEGDGQSPALAGLSPRRQPAALQNETLLFEVSTRAAPIHKTHRELPKGSRPHSCEAISSVSPHSGLASPGLAPDHRSSEVTSRSQETVKGQFRRLLSRQFALEKLPVTPVSPAASPPGLQDRRHRKLQRKSPTTSLDARGCPFPTEISAVQESQQNLISDSRPATAAKSASPVLRRQLGKTDLVSPKHNTSSPREGVKRQRSKSEVKRPSDQSDEALEPSLPSDVGVDFLIRSLYPADFLSTLRPPHPNRAADKNKMGRSKTPDASATQGHKSPLQRLFSPAVTPEEGIAIPRVSSPAQQKLKTDAPPKPPPPKKDKAKPVIQGDGASPIADQATPKKPVPFQKKTNILEVTARPVPVHKKPRNRRNGHRSYEAVGAVSPSETQPDHRSSETALSPPLSPSQDTMKDDVRGRLLRQPALVQLPVMPAPAPAVGQPIIPKRRVKGNKERKMPKDLPVVSPKQAQEQPEPAGGAPDRVQLVPTGSVSVDEVVAVKRAPSALRRRMGSTDLTVAQTPVPTWGARPSRFGTRRLAMVPDHEVEDTIRLAAESRDHKLPFPVPSDVGAGFLFESPVESSRSMLTPIAPVRRFRPTRTLSLPDLSDESLMVAPEFLRSRQVLKTDDTVYLPYILRKEYVIRTKLRVMFRLLRPEPPRLFRAYSEGYITKITFLNEYRDRLGVWSDREEDEGSEWTVEEGCNFFSLCQLHVKCCRKKHRGRQPPPKVQFT